MFSVTRSEFDAAQALLLLCGPSQNEGEQPNEDVYMADADSYRRQYLNMPAPVEQMDVIPVIAIPNPVVVVPNAQPSTSKAAPKVEAPVQELIRNQQLNGYHEASESSRKIKGMPMKYYSVKSYAEAAKENVGVNRTYKIARWVETADSGTQTMDLSELPIIKEMKETIRKQQEEIAALKAEIVELKKQLAAKNNEDKTDQPNANDSAASQQDAGVTPRRVGSSRAAPQQRRARQILTDRNINTDANGMVPIGNGNALIPSRIFRHINWKSHSSATRKLLTAVFSRQVLATHSLSGKQSPAFRKKPCKDALDSDIVNDIIVTVMERCNVPENVVRSSITSKCADESKMQRARQGKKKKRSNKENTTSDAESGAA